MVLDQYMSPEILRVRLDEVILSCKILELGRVQSFLDKLMDSPSETAVRTGLSTLEAIRALDNTHNMETLTPLGIPCFLLHHKF